MGRKNNARINALDRTEFILYFPKEKQVLINSSNGLFFDLEFDKHPSNQYRRGSLPWVVLPFFYAELVRNQQRLCRRTERRGFVPDRQHSSFFLIHPIMCLSELGAPSPGIPFVCGLLFFRGEACMRGLIGKRPVSEQAPIGHIR